MQKTERPELAGLPEREARILVFEQRPWRHAGAKEEAIRVELGLSTARYYQLLNAAIDTPAATIFDPMLVRRLQRQRGEGARGGAGGSRPGDGEVE